MAVEYLNRTLVLNSNDVNSSSALPCASHFVDSNKYVERRIEARRNGQNLAGSGALVFEGELLEIPIWN